MSTPAVAIQSTGLATSVGLTTRASSAAIRAKLTNPTETGFIDSGGEWIMGHRVPLDIPWVGRTRLMKMAALVIEECLEKVPRDEWGSIPMLLCVSERERPGRPDEIEDELLLDIGRELRVRFPARSLVIPQGRVSATVALSHARRLLAEKIAERVLIVGTDSFLSWRTVHAYDQDARLLTSTNSNGFMPGEGAGAILVGGAPIGRSLLCEGIGLATEASTINSDAPLRADGLTRAISDALRDAGCQMQELDLRIVDLSGEQYYFKEASIALARLLRVRREHFQMWHHAECIGECGAASGVVSIVLANAGCAAGFSPGHNILCHSANDCGRRAAGVFAFRDMS